MSATPYMQCAFLWVKLTIRLTSIGHVFASSKWYKYEWCMSALIKHNNWPGSTLSVGNQKQYRFILNKITGSISPSIFWKYGFDENLMNMYIFFVDEAISWTTGKDPFLSFQCFHTKYSSISIINHKSVPSASYSWKLHDEFPSQGDTELPAFGGKDGF